MTTRRSSRLAAATPPHPEDTIDTSNVTIADAATNSKKRKAKTATTAAKKKTTKKAAPKKAAPKKATPPAPQTATKAPTPAAAAKIVTPALDDAAATTGKKPSSHPVDCDISVAGQSAADYKVLHDPDDSNLWYDSVLNQCNIGGNNNKYYRLQLLQHKTQGSFHSWFRWGRVGEPSRSSSSTWQTFSTFDGAAREFKKKFKSKSANHFGAEPFVPKSGKYTMIEIDNDVEVPDDYVVAPPAATTKIEYEECKLDAKTKDLIGVLFSEETRNTALSSFNLDLKRLPLGVPSPQQINKGVAILSQLEDQLKGTNNSGESFQTLSSKFYTAIPHSFGRSVPPVIQTLEDVRSRFDMCNVLLDMYDTNQTVQRLRKEQAQAAAEPTVKLLPNPTDQHYGTLKADLSLLETKSNEFKVISQYFEDTKSSHCRSKILNVWSVDRSNEASRFAKYDSVQNRRLLWHGTNVAVVAPIITSGLRIMPHSGGRVGSGVYLAGMQQKSAQYTSGYGAKFACMFLCEAPLGKQHLVTQDGHHASSLKKAPAGFDSVHAVGNVQTTKSTSFDLDGRTVTVPNGPGTQQQHATRSSFEHDEFLVYNEDQVRLRYVLTVQL